MVYGFGLKSCGQFVEARLEAQQSPYSPYSPYTDSPYISWLGGFLTATSTWLAATRTEPPETDVSAATIWIENYCRQNPLQQFHTAAVALVHHMTVTQAPAVRSAR
jgi:hypothetical protein